MEMNVNFGVSPGGDGKGRRGSGTGSWEKREGGLRVGNPKAEQKAGVGARGPI